MTAAFPVRHYLTEISGDGARPGEAEGRTDRRVSADAEQQISDVQQQLELIENRWAVFPLVRLRPEQVIGAMLQANHVTTIDQNSHLFVRALRFLREQGFVNEFGDPGEAELQDRVGTISQALLRMNGQLPRELTRAGPFSAPGRIAGMASTPEQCLDDLQPTFTAVPEVVNAGEGVRLEWSAIRQGACASMTWSITGPGMWHPPVGPASSKTVFPGGSGQYVFRAHMGGLTRELATAAV